MAPNEGLAPMTDHSASETTDTASQENKPGVPLNERSLPIDEFCVVEGFSRSFFNKLRRLNLAPHVTEIFGPGLNLQRITPESCREWHTRMKKYRQSKEAQIAAERQRQHLPAAGQKSAESALHVSKTGRKKRSPAASAAGRRCDDGDRHCGHRHSRRADEVLRPALVATLADSIASQGLHQPIILRPRKGGGFTLIAGREREARHEAVRRHLRRSAMERRSLHLG